MRPDGLRMDEEQFLTMRLVPVVTCRIWPSSYLNAVILGDGSTIDRTTRDEQTIDRRLHIVDQAASVLPAGYRGRVSEARFSQARSMIRFKNREFLRLVHMSDRKHNKLRNFLFAA